MEGLFLETGIVTSGARGVSTIFTEKDSVMNFITLSLHPFEKSFQTNKFTFPIKKNFFLVWLKFFKWFLGWDSMAAASVPQVLIKIFISGRVPGSKGPFLQRLFGIWDDLFPINSNNPSKSLTGGAGTDRAVEGEEKGFGFRKVPSTTITGEASFERDAFTFFHRHFDFTVP
jgi:hypothetical protein